MEAEPEAELEAGLAAVDVVMVALVCTDPAEEVSVSVALAMVVVVFVNTLPVVAVVMPVVAISVGVI